MSTWFLSNWINVVLIALLLLIVGLILRSSIRQKRAGKLPCGCDCGGACSGCAMGGVCHGADRK